MSEFNIPDNPRFPAWKDAPEGEGWYWVWWAHPWPDCERMQCVYVSRRDDGGLEATVPGMDYCDPIDLEETWGGSKWAGPLAVPEPPKP